MRTNLARHLNIGENAIFCGRTSVELCTREVNLAEHVPEDRPWTSRRSPPSRQDRSGRFRRTYSYPLTQPRFNTVFIFYRDPAARGLNGLFRLSHNYNLKLSL